jgi:hypothetical protein
MANRMTTGNLTIYRGQDYSIPATITSADGGVFDISAVTFSAPISRFENSPPAASFTITKTTAASGLLTLSLNTGETLGLPWAGCHWNLWAINSGVRQALIKGEITIEGGVG